MEKGYFINHELFYLEAAIVVARGQRLFSVGEGVLGLIAVIVWQEEVR